MTRLAGALLFSLLIAGRAGAQLAGSLAINPGYNPQPEVNLPLIGGFTSADSESTSLPESPGALTIAANESMLGDSMPEDKSNQASKNCLPAGQQAVQVSEPSSPQNQPVPCVVAPVNPYRRFLDTTAPLRLSPRQKGYLAVRNFADPFSLLTIVGNSAFTIGIDSHTAYGPGMAGFGRNVGYSLLQDATGEFIGTFAVCSLLHQDPHYHRMPKAKPLRRVGHALARTVIAQHDDGSLMPNYENFISYPASAVISNLYIPGVHGNLQSTVARIMIGLSTDPAGNLITEFLPDLAKRVHIRTVFVQDIINRVARGDE